MMSHFRTHRLKYDVIAQDAVDQQRSLQSLSRMPYQTRPLLQSGVESTNPPPMCNLEHSKFQSLWRLIDSLAQWAIDLLRKISPLRKRAFLCAQELLQNRQIFELQERCIEREQRNSRSSAKSDVWKMIVDASEFLKGDTGGLTHTGEQRTGQLFAALTKLQFESIKRTLTIAYDLSIYKFKEMQNVEELKRELKRQIHPLKRQELPGQSAFTPKEVDEAMAFIDGQLEDPRNYLSPH